MEQNFSEFKIGNWVIYLPEGNYCTIKSLTPHLELEGALQNYTTTIEDIGRIPITIDKLQVCGFDNEYPYFLKKGSNDIFVALVFSNSGSHKVCKDVEHFCNVRFIHQLQNAYLEITGDLLQGNLFGVREQ